jgi:hypothetical protein
MAFLLFVFLYIDYCVKDPVASYYLNQLIILIFNSPKIGPL